MALLLASNAQEVIIRQDRYYVEWPAGWQIVMWIIAALAIWDMAKWLNGKWLGRSPKEPDVPRGPSGISPSPDGSR